MFAVIESGGKQYKVTEGQTVLVDLFETPEKNKVIFNKVLLINDKDKVTIGQPIIENAVVEAEYIADTKGKKLEVFKMKRRKSSKTKIGHRQKYSKVKIVKIALAGAKTAKKEEAKKEPAPKTAPAKSESKKAEKETAE